MEQEFPLETIQTENQQQTHTRVIIFVGIIAFFSVGLGGVFLGKHLYAPKTAPVIPDATPTLTSRTDAPTVTPTTNQTESWTTHTNTDYGFSLKHPFDWRVEQKYLDSHFKSQVFPGKTKYYVELTSSDKSTSILILPEGELDAGLEDTVKGTTEISGIAVTTYTYQNGLMMFTNFKRQNLPYFRLQVKPKNTQVDQILSTFKFLDGNDVTANWQTHIDSEAGFSIQFPVGWRKVELRGVSKGVGVGPKEVGEDVLWAVNVYDASQKSRLELIDEIGNQFLPYRKQNQEQITVNGARATKVTTTTGEIQDWYSVTILIEHKGSIFSISNGAIGNEKLATFPGVPESLTFEDFYSTFKLF